MINDTQLEGKIARLMLELLQEIQEIGCTPLRQSLDSQIVDARNQLLAFDEKLWQKNLDKGFGGALIDGLRNPLRDLQRSADKGTTHEAHLRGLHNG